mgnify:CR=1 FL=1
MAVTTVAQFAAELNRPAGTLLEQLQSAGVAKKSLDDALTDADKERLLEYLRNAHGTSADRKKITLTRKSTSEIKQADASGKARTIQVEVRKKRTFVKRDDMPAGADEAAAAAAASEEAELQRREEEANAQAEQLRRQEEALAEQARQRAERERQEREAAEAAAKAAAEARAAAAAGADVIVAQGSEAGGHRGAFDAASARDAAVGLFALLGLVDHPAALGLDIQIGA